MNCLFEMISTLLNDAAGWRQGASVAPSLYGLGGSEIVRRAQLSLIRCEAVMRTCNCTMCRRFCGIPVAPIAANSPQHCDNMFGHASFCSSESTCTPRTQLFRHMTHAQTSRKLPPLDRGVLCGHDDIGAGNRQTICGTRDSCGLVSVWSSITPRMAPPF